MKKLGKLMCTTLALVMATGGIVGCGKDEEVMKTEGQSYISLRINPEIELISNEDNLVIAANAINEDGEVVLSVSDFIGDSIEVATEEFVDTAVDLGYIDVESEESTVYVHVEGIEEFETTEIEEKIKNKVNHYFDNNGIFGKVEKEDMEVYLEKAEELNRSVGHIKMMTRILELYPEKTEEELLKLPVKELIRLLKDDAKKNGLKATLREEYKTEVKALKLEYAEMFELLDELENLEAQLTNSELSEDERKIIESRIIEIKDTCVIMKKTYQEEVDKLKETYKEQVDTIVKEFKGKADKKKKDNASKIEKHLQDFTKDKENIKNKIQDWREGLEG